MKRVIEFYLGNDPDTRWEFDLDADFGGIVPQAEDIILDPGPPTAPAGAASPDSFRVVAIRHLRPQTFAGPSALITMPVKLD